MEPRIESESSETTPNSHSDFDLLSELTAATEAINVVESDDVERGIDALTADDWVDIDTEIKECKTYGTQSWRDIAGRTADEADRQFCERGF